MINARYGTHLTVDFGGDVKADEVQDHCRERGNTRDAVYLSKGTNQSHALTQNLISVHTHIDQR
jgi:hypothetical protein